MKNQIIATLKKLPLAMLGSLLIGIGIAFNACAGLGNDPIGLVYDGIRNLFGLEPSQLGMCAEFANYLLVALLLVVGRRYLNIGTILAILPYRLCMRLGVSLYARLFPSADLPTRILSLAIGCLLIYIGIAIFLFADIGMEPITGILMVIKDATHLSFIQTKWVFDFSMLGVGWLLGGQLGIVTFITAVIAGPIIGLLYAILFRLYTYVTIKVAR